jgi:hypothetical protein
LREPFSAALASNCWNIAPVFLVAVVALHPSF